MKEPTPPSPTDSMASEQGETLLVQGRTYYAQAQYQEALSCLHLAYDACLAQEQATQATTSQAAAIANDIGVVYTVLERWGEAEKWLREAQKRFAQDGDLAGEAQTLGNVGSMYRTKKTIDRPPLICSCLPIAFTWRETMNAVPCHCAL